MQVLSECTDIDSEDVMKEIRLIENQYPQVLNPAVEGLFIGSPIILNKYIKGKDLYDMQKGFKMWLLGNISINDEDRIRALDALTENVDIQDYIIHQFIVIEPQTSSNFLITRYASNNYIMSLFLKSANMLAADSAIIHEISAQDDEYKRNYKGKLKKEIEILVETYPLTLQCLQELLAQDKLKNNKEFHAWIEDKS